MATFYADTAAAIQPAGAKTKSNKYVGRVRYLEAIFVVPVGGVAIGDEIVWAKPVPGTRVLAQFANVDYSAGAASSTINLGDNVTPTRYMAATSVAAAGTTAFTKAANGASNFEMTDNSGGATDNCTIKSIVAGAALQAGQSIVVRMQFVND